MSGIPDSLAEKILNARSLDGALPAEPLVPFTNIGDLLNRQVDRHEQKPFLIFYDDASGRREYSYREFYDDVTKAASFLKSAGINPGDRIATVSFNHSDVVIQYFAAFLLGAVVVPINVGEDDRRITYILQNSEVKLAFVRDSYVARISEIAPRVPSLRTIVQTGRVVRPDLPHFRAELAKQAGSFVPAHQPRFDDDALPKLLVRDPCAGSKLVCCCHGRLR